VVQMEAFFRNLLGGTAKQLPFLDYRYCVSHKVLLSIWKVYIQQSTINKISQLLSKNNTWDFGCTDVSYAVFSVTTPCFT
jgi:hypothetical protein